MDVSVTNLLITVYQAMLDKETGQAVCQYELEGQLNLRSYLARYS